MKKLIAFLLAAAFLCGAALAEELPWLQQVPVNERSDGTFLPPELYSRICLASFEPISQVKHDHMAVTFTAPANACAWHYSLSSVQFRDETAGLDYTFSLNRGVVNFLKDSDNEKTVIYDDDRRAAYVNAGRRRASALIYLPEIEDSTMWSLGISVGMDSVPKESALETLTELLVGEIERVESEMILEPVPDLYEKNLYAGVKMICPKPNKDLMLAFAMPVMTWYSGDGAPQAQMTLSYLDDTSVKGFFPFTEKSNVAATISLHNKAQSNSNTDDCTTVTLPNGMELSITLSGLKKNGSSSTARVDFKVPGLEDLYVKITLDGYGVRWSSFDEVMTNAGEIVTSMFFVRVEDDPYVPGEAAAAPSESDEG